MTQETDKENYLTGKLLLAMPVMQDPRFLRSVIYVCTHNEFGAMGLVINQPLDGLIFADLIKQLNLIKGAPKFNLPVNLGGPVEPARGFILHSSDYTQEDTMLVDSNIAVTASLDILREIAEGRGPDKKFFALGYAGWGAGQLEDELQQNAWLTLEADRSLIFDTDVHDKWDKALAHLGIDPVMLSSDTGSA